jgi:hypothetical protein
MKSIKKAQDGLTTKDRLAQAKENRRKLDSITAIKRAEIVRKKDSIIQRNANARGLSVSDYKNTVRKESKKPDVGIETCGPNFKSTKCGVSKAASKESKSDWGKKKNGGSLSGLKASNKRVGSEKGAFIDVQKKALAGAKGKAKLVKDKQLGATKMTAKKGIKISKNK